MQRHHDDALASASIAFEAGQLLLTLRERSAATGVTTSGHSADVDANDLIAHRLAATFPHDSILTEEGADTDERLGAERVWIIDPLDGTREYNEPPRTDWAVHVALWEGGELVAGTVAMPATGALLSTVAQLPTPPRADGPLRVVVSRTRPPREAEKVRAALGATLVPMGSAGAKAMAVVRGEVDAYVHSGGQWEWDSAAPAAVARANGLHASRIDGSAFAWNKSRPWQPDLLICRPEVAETILEVLALDEP